MKNPGRKKMFPRRLDLRLFRKLIRNFQKRNLATSKPAPVEVAELEVRRNVGQPSPFTHPYLLAPDDVTYSKKMLKIYLMLSQFLRCEGREFAGRGRGRLEYLSPALPHAGFKQHPTPTGLLDLRNSGGQSGQVFVRFHYSIFAPTHPV